MKTFSRVMLGLMVLLSVGHAVDFIAYGGKLRSAMAAVGFGLMAYGAWRNPMDQVTVQGGPVARDETARHLSAIGMALVAIYFVLKVSGYSQ